MEREKDKSEKYLEVVTSEDFKVFGFTMKEILEIRRILNESGMKVSDLGKLPIFHENINQSGDIVNYNYKK